MGTPVGNIAVNATRRRNVRGAMVVGAVVVLCAGLSGCGYGDVEFKGKIFDAMGVNSGSSKKKVKLAPRTGLVTPPSLERLPEPGSAVSGGEGLASIHDPDRAKVVDARELALRQAAYCKKHYDPLVLRGDASAEGIEGPAGPCRATVFTALKKANGEPSPGQ